MPGPNLADQSLSQKAAAQEFKVQASKIQASGSSQDNTTHGRPHWMDDDDNEDFDERIRTARTIGCFSRAIHQGLRFRFLSRSKTYFHDESEYGVSEMT